MQWSRFSDVKAALKSVENIPLNRLEDRIGFERNNACFSSSVNTTDLVFDSVGAFKLQSDAEHPKKHRRSVNVKKEITSSTTGSNSCRSSGELDSGFIFPTFS